MKKRVLFFVFVVFAMILASCAPAAAPEAGASGGNEAAAGEPAVCAEDEYGCAVVPAGQTIKLGMGAPMTGD